MSNENQEEQFQDSIGFLQNEVIDSEDVIEVANERVTEKVMEVLAPQEHVKALKSKIKAAKK